MPTTILDGETYEQARHRRFTEEAKVIEKMQQDEIIRMAKESGAVERYFGNQLHGIAFHKKEWLERFATLVAAHERRKCEQEMSLMEEHCAELILIEREKQAKQEPVACNCGTNPWHDCNESEGCRIKKSLGISSRPVYDQRADHHKMMLGYEIATKYGVFENKAFQLCDEMKKLYAAPVQQVDLTDDEIMDLVRNECVDMRWPSTPLFIARTVIQEYRSKK